MVPEVRLLDKELRLSLVRLLSGLVVSPVEPLPSQITITYRQQDNMALMVVAVVVSPALVQEQLVMQEYQLLLEVVLEGQQVEQLEGTGLLVLTVLMVLVVVVVVVVVVAQLEGLEALEVYLAVEVVGEVVVGLQTV